MSHAKRTKTAENSGGLPKVPQAHGGALLLGGVPGNKGGPGRPSREMREQLRERAAARYHVLEETADGVIRLPLTRTCEHCGKSPTKRARRGRSDLDPIELAAKSGDRLRALELMFRFGLGEQREVVDSESIRDSLRAQRKIIREILPEDVAEALLQRLRLEVWG
jgi:hypothetical protein